ncbi:glycoside hydrolase family 78 protein [Aestuariibaculum sp. M13]|uniref:alpha-L-rhamnosidase n=1 Tax=Aestuariibaculum sp. M13 TaxID=2967132 RepID=UPI002159DBFE|nr:alpha-L-rhamnosidase [Aestuariibaculum sp. M13]MCR8668971.1 glycoside hydrolase family 78 protein [Aestuariibaculum sp. M13]
MRVIICCFLAFLVSTGCKYNKTRVDDLMVEYLETPIGIDEFKPRFSWKMVSGDDKNNLFQKAYQIIVKDVNELQVWDSGKVESDISLNIEFEGESLRSESKYTWDLKVWNQNDEVLTNKSWFETGLMNSDIMAWEGATWIGGSQEDMVLYSHALSVFKLSYDVKLDEESQSSKAGFVFGANDRRLMDKNSNIMGVENGKDQSYFVFELNVDHIKNINGNATLDVYRVGYTSGDSESEPLYSYIIPRSLINTENKYDWHQVYFEMNFGKCLIYIDGKENKNIINEPMDVPNWVDVRGVSLNPLGDNGGDLIVYPLLADIGFKMDQGQKASFKNLKVKNFRQPSNTVFQENLKGSVEYKGVFQEFINNGVEVLNGQYKVGASNETVFITANPSKNSMPMLRTEFSVDNSIQSAKLYVTARGIYELYLNGKRISNDYFNPGLTQYNKTHMYQTYDVTELLNNGKNAFGALLGEGWWSGNATYRGYNWNYFGDRQSLLVKLKLTFQDGSTKIVTTNPDEWKYFNDGPIEYSSFFQGEYYNAMKEKNIEGWNQVGYDDELWKTAVEVNLNSKNAYIDKELNYDDLKIIGQIGENATIVKTLTAQSMEEVRPGVFVYDMGQNMVGFPEINLSGEAGDTITLRYAEMKYPNLDEYKGNVGMIMMENIRGALATDKWILKGTTSELIRPRFTFHGYRYIEITGIEKPVPIESVKGKVISSINELASSYNTSNKLVNKLWQNITWSFRGNFLSIPTDTPARNERMGWNGDINVFAKTATYLGHVDLFLKRHLIANRDLQESSGRFPDIAPVGTGFGGTLWGSAGVTIPWELYQQYGDKRIIENHYEAMKRYVDFLESKEDKETGVLDEGPLGDWLSPEGFKNDNSLFWTAYQVRSLEILYKSAELLGKHKDREKYKSYYENRKVFFNETYVDAITGKTIHSGYSGASLATKPKDFLQPEKGNLVDTQASYAIPLSFNVFDEKYKLLARQYLVQAVSRQNADFNNILRPVNSLMTGFVGTVSLGIALSEGYNDEAIYNLLQQTSYPSWLYSVTNGATTIWERLNSYTKEEGFGGNNSMNSFNHYSFGAVGAWMYGYSLGIRPLKTGYKEFILSPTPDPTGNMDWAEGYYNSTYGTIKSKWVVEGDKTTYYLTIPPNTTAKVRIKYKQNQNIEVFIEDKLKIIQQYNKIEGNRKEYSLGSGEYTIEVK